MIEKQAYKLIIIDWKMSICNRLVLEALGSQQEPCAQEAPLIVELSVKSLKRGMKLCV